MGVGERRRGGHRRAHHHHHHHRNRHHHHRNHRRHHRNRGLHGGRLFTFGIRNRTGIHHGTGGGGPGVAFTPGYVVILILFTMFGMFGFGVGMALANIGGWTSSTLGIVGMVFLLISVIFVAIVVAIRCHMQKSLSNPAVEVEAGTANSNMALSTVTLGGSSTAASQGGDATSYVIPTGAVQPGGIAMGTQPGYPGGTSQPYPPPPPQGYPGVPYPPDPNGAIQYPPPSNPLAAPSMPYPPAEAPMPYPPVEAPPVTYTALSPPQPAPTNNRVGVVDQPSDVNDIAPPPSYNDVMSGNVKSVEGSDPT